MGIETNVLMSLLAFKNLHELSSLVELAGGKLSEDGKMLLC